MQAKIEDICARRTMDPQRITAWKLAEEYGCSRLLVSMVAPIRNIDVQVKASESLMQMTEAKRGQLEKEKEIPRREKRKEINREVRRSTWEMW
ncbi:hypothetical protein M407DRAFT_246175 [Tulasnella calospora MUT 4182]|uniref:Uncharacterized protein n=1 Tax=Tulasnella calospora MUT 4182 TaxID=1051891 RepID=A0A0C3LD93_9AGAM|nr:hypothetical protein M407DRAFT_246175 [Tulasnella calospora MUT 4182]